MMLLERDEQLDELNRHLAAAGGGNGRLVLIAGEAGIGKSTLVDEFCRRAARSARIARASCDSLSTPGPLGPILDLGPTLGLDLDQLLNPQRRRDEIFHAMLATLRGRDEPTVIVGEDAHWSDEASIDLLRFLGRRVGGVRLLVLVTYRDDELGPMHPLRGVIGDLASSSSIFRIVMKPLTLDAVTSLATGSTQDPSELLRRTGGNPFFITEVLASRVEGVPSTVSDAVLARAARVSPDGRAVLDVAAVIGSVIEADLLLSVAGPVAEATDECIGAGLLRHHAEGVAFRHDLVRDAVLAQIALPRRRLLHRRVLDALAADPLRSRDYARLAHHAEAGGDVALIRRYATAAASQAAALDSHREEAAQYARLLRVAADLRDTERAGLLEKYSFACYLSSQGSEAIDTGREAVDIWRRSGDRRKEGDGWRWLSRAYWFEGHSTEARQAGTYALQILEELPPGRELAMAYSNMSQLEMLRWNTTGAIHWGEKAIALAEQLGEQETLVHALNNVWTVRCLQDDPEAPAMLLRTHQLASEAGLIDHACRALVNAAWSSMVNLRLDEADGYFDAALAYASEHDLDNYFRYLIATRATIKTYRGDWDAALADVAEVLAMPAVSALARIVALTIRGRVLVRRGDAGHAAALDEALELALRTGELQRLAPVRLARAEAAWLAGDADASAAEARAILVDASQFLTWPARGEAAYWLHLCDGVSSHAHEPAGPFALMVDGRWEEAAHAWQELGCVFERACALCQCDDEAAIREASEVFTSLAAEPAEIWASRRLREIGVRPVHRGPRASTLANPSGLTQREMDVLALLVNGLSNADIATRLFISPKTAGHHVSAILAKLGVTSRSAAARLALEFGTLEPQK